jgi:hypothetical protein
MKKMEKGKLGRKVMEKKGRNSKLVVKESSIELKFKIKIYIN